MSHLDRITSFHGKLSDSKVIWWPFLFLKPETSRTPITWKRLSFMIPCFAAWMMPGLLIREWIIGNSSPLALPELARVYGFLLLTFFLWFSLVTVPLWNRRANALGASCH